MKIQNYISDYSDVEAYNASMLNCYAFRHGYDVRQGLSLSLGNSSEPSINYALLNSKHIHLRQEIFLL